jgi:hypothetical protein
MAMGTASLSARGSVEKMYNLNLETEGRPRLPPWCTIIKSNGVCITSIGPTYVHSSVLSHNLVAAHQSLVHKFHTKLVYGSM